jgi:hypothetical protein
MQEVISIYIMSLAKIKAIFGIVVGLVYGIIFGIFLRASGFRKE